MKIVQKSSTNTSCSFEVQQQGGIRKLGIQAPQGSKIFLNNTESIIEMNHFGVYELDLIKFGYGLTKVEVQLPPSSSTNSGENTEQQSIEQHILIDAVIEGEIKEEEVTEV